MLLHSWTFALNRYIVRDIAVNIALYIPAGIAGNLAFRKFGKTWLSLTAPVLICTLWSASIEMLQLYVPSRTCSAIDLVTNIIGAIIGVSCTALLEDVFLLNRAHAAADLSRKPRRQPDRAALALLTCWVVWLLFPVFPVMGRYVLNQKLHVFLHSPVMDPLPFLSMAVVWYAAGTLCRAAALRPARWLTVISILLIPAQFFIVNRRPVRAELAGAIAGAAFFALLWQKRTPRGTRYWKILAAVFLATIVMHGLAPFRLLTAPVPFSPIPFAAFLNMEWQPGIQILAQKTFWYATAIWLVRASGTRLRTATGIVAVTLLLIEIAQTRISGHTPEITDPLWAIFLGWALHLIAPPAVPVDNPAAR